MEERLTQLSALTATLQRARARMRVGNWLVAANWGLAAGLVLFIALELLRRQAPVLWQASLGDPAAGAGVAPWAALVVGCAAMAVALIARPAPDVAALARRADSRFGLDERLSTAFDVERRGGRDAAPSLVAQLLLGDAARNAGKVDPRVLAPIRLGWPMLLVPVLALVALGVVTMVPQVSIATPPPTVSGSSAVLDSSSRAELAADIERVAALVQAQAETRSDAAMQAVARTLQNLGERLATDPEMSHGDIVEELGALRDYAALAATDWRGAVGQRVPELLEALTTRAETAIQPQGTQQAPPDLPPNMMGEPGAPEPAAPGQAPAPGATESAAASTDGLGAMLDEMEQSARGSGQPMPSGANEGDVPRVGVDYFAAAQAQNAARSNEPAPNADGAQLIGPSSNAQAGDSLLAGQGTDAIDGAEPAATELSFETSDDLVLEAKDPGGGRRIEMEIAPPAQLTEVTQERLEDGAAGWARLPEPEVGRAFVGAQHRNMVSTYRLELSGQGQQ